MNKPKEITVKLVLEEELFPTLFKMDKDCLGEVCFEIFKTGYYHTYPSEMNLTNHFLNHKLENSNKLIQENMHKHTDSIKLDLEQIKSKVSYADLDEKFDKISYILEELLGINNNSCKKGKLSEEMIYQMLKNKFKDYTIEETRSIPHCGDAIINIPFNNQNVRVMVEIKNYTATVNKTEIDKLKYDMKRVNIKYALMISLKTGFVGYKQMDIDEFTHNDEVYNIIYLPNLLGQVDKIEACMIMIKRLIEHNEKIKVGRPSYTVIQDQVRHHLQELDNVYTDFSIFKDSYYNMEKSIRKTLHDYYIELRNYEIKMKDRINTVWKAINADFNKVESDLINVNSIEGLNKNMNMINEVLIKNRYHLEKTKNKKSFLIIDELDMMVGTLIKQTKIIQLRFSEPKFNYTITTAKAVKEQLITFDSMFKEAIKTLEG